MKAPIFSTISCLTLLVNVFFAAHAAMSSPYPNEEENQAFFSNDVILEVFAFHKRDDITCEAILEAEFAIFKQAKPFAREKAEITNNGGRVSFAMNNLQSNIDIVIFVRAIDLSTNTIQAVACEDNIRTKANEQKEISLSLIPILNPV